MICVREIDKWHLGEGGGEKKEGGEKGVSKILLKEKKEGILQYFSIEPTPKKKKKEGERKKERWGHE